MRGRARRIFFVPITINYEIVLEAETLIEDFLKEQGKTRYIIEDDEFSQIDRWFSFFGQLRDHDAGCVLRIGTPIDPFGNLVNDQGESLAPDGRIIDPAEYVRSGGEAKLDSERDAAYTRELGERIMEAYKRNTVVMATQLVAHVFYRALVIQTEGLDLFARMRCRGEVRLSRAEAHEQLERCRAELLEIESEGSTVLGASVREAPPEQLLQRALDAWRYHTRTILRQEGDDLIVEDPPLLLFYHHRIVTHAGRLATNQSERDAAIEMARVWRVQS
jgi:glycerol-3-phosphate O-acyltransferase